MSTTAMPQTHKTRQQNVCSSSSPLQLVLAPKQTKKNTKNHSRKAWTPRPATVTYLYCILLSFKRLCLIWVHQVQLESLDVYKD